MEEETFEETFQEGEFVGSEDTSTNTGPDPFAGLMDAETREKLAKAADIGRQLIGHHGADRILMGAGVGLLIAGFTVNVTKKK